jgi:hypothetical protein
MNWYILVCTGMYQYVYCYVENLMPCPLTNFGQISATLSPHSTTTSSRNPALGEV